MPLYIGDYLSDTMHLTRDQHGAYILLIMAYWRNGGPLPDDDCHLAAIAKASQTEWQTLRPPLVTFFKVGRGIWRHKRIDAELDAARNRLNARKAAGLKGAEARWQNQWQNDGKAQLQDSILSETKRESISPRAHTRGNGQVSEIKENGSLGSLRSPAASPPLRERKKEQLRQKLMRFAQATRSGKELSAAIEGLMGEDPLHSAQSWLDSLDQQMRAVHWDDTRRSQ
jgi:uncharacterized protein YdaU (DUF1376 family)